MSSRITGPALAIGPVIRGAVEAASRRDMFTQKDISGPRLLIPPKQFLRSFPIVSTVERAIRQEDPLTAAGKPRLTVPNQSTRIAGINVPNEALNYLGYPVRVKNLDTAEAIAEKNLREDLSPEEREFRKVFSTRNQTLAAFKKHNLKLEDGRLPQSLRQAFNAKAERFAAYAHMGKKPTLHDRFDADLTLFAKHGLASPSQAAEARDWASTATEDAIRDVRNGWSQKSDGAWRKLYLDAVGYAREAIKDSGGDADFLG